VGEQGPVDIECAIAAVRDVVADRMADLGTTVIDGDTQLDQLSLDSLDLAELFTILEERSGAFLDASSVERIVVVADLTRLEPAPL